MEVIICFQIIIFTDVLNDEGWDIVTLNPFKLSKDKKQ